jgi:hypothetical protein
VVAMRGNDDNGGRSPNLSLRGSNLVWTIVGILLIIVLALYLFHR